MCPKLQQAARARLQEEDEHSNRYLQELSVTQELFAADRPALGTQGKGQRRVAVFLWRFRRAWPGEAATTIWRRLNHPNQPSTDPQLQHLIVPSTGPMIAPVETQDKGFQDSTYLGGEQLQEPAIQYEIAPSFWDNGWVQSQMSRPSEIHEDASANGSFQTCPANYAYMDPSPSNQNSHDSGYGSQTTSYTSQTPLMPSADGGHAYMESSQHDSNTASYGYEDLQHVHEMAMSSFGPVDMYDSHSHSQEAPQPISHEDLVSANLFTYNNGQMQLHFLPDDHSNLGLSGHDAASAAHGTEQGSHAHDPSHDDGGGDDELHAPQPMHAHSHPNGQLLETALHFAASTGHMFPTSQCLPSSSSSTIACSNAEASMLLHLANSGTEPHHHLSQQDATQNSAHASPPSSRNPSIHSLPTSMSSSSASQVASALWAPEHLHELPQGLFLDVGATLGNSLLLSNGSGPHPHSNTSTAASAGTSANAPEAAINAFDPAQQASRERAQETGRLLGALLGTGATATGASIHGHSVPTVGDGGHGTEPDEEAWHQVQAGQMREYTQAHGYDHAHGQAEEEWRGRLARMVGV
jgi:hypothetical protein